ncbi:hypothetical protein V6N13_059143 [Hibiscus sabdariffa]
MKADETPPQHGKVSKKGVKMPYTKCGGSNPNTRTCKGSVRGNARPHQQASTSITRRIPTLLIRRTSGTTMHQDQSNTPSPRQPPPSAHIVRWMHTPTFL